MSKHAHPSHGRRQLLRYAGASLILSVTPLAGAAARLPSILAVRIWPAADYTRVTLEHDGPLKFTHFLIENPDRLVVDIEGVEFNSVLDSLSRKLTTDDPNIKLLRAGRFKPGVVRLVMELKTKVNPQVFTLDPAGDYGHRLVLDVYPVNPPDPMMALLEGRKEAVEPPKNEQDFQIVEKKTDDLIAKQAENKPLEAPEVHTSKKSGKPIVDRLVTITLDPGHGGEDPGAIGKAGSYEKNVTLEVARRLKARIDAEPNMRAVLTRDSDFFETVAKWDDPNETVERRVRAYLDINCAHCHSTGRHCDYRPIRFDWNLTTDPVNLGVCVPPDDPIQPSQQYIVYAGNKARSMLYFRMSSNEEAERMPLMGRTVRHEEAIALIGQWIDAMPDTCQ